MPIQVYLTWSYLNMAFAGSDAIASDQEYSTLDHNMDKLHQALDFLKELAARKESTPAQIALAWLLAQKPWVVPIPGGTKIEHLDDNLQAADLVLTTDDLLEIDQAFATIDIKGAQLSAALDAAIDRKV